MFYYVLLGCCVLNALFECKMPLFLLMFYLSGVRNMLVRGNSWLAVKTTMLFVQMSKFRTVLFLTKWDWYELIKVLLCSFFVWNYWVKMLFCLLNFNFFFYSLYFEFFNSFFLVKYNLLFSCFSGAPHEHQCKFLLVIEIPIWRFFYSTYLKCFLLFVLLAVVCHLFVVFCPRIGIFVSSWFHGYLTLNWTR